MKTGNYDINLTVIDSIGCIEKLNTKENTTKRFKLIRKAPAENFPVTVSGTVGDIAVYEHIDNTQQADEFINALHTNPPFENMNSEIEKMLK